jgi:hypothetical protein
MSDQGSIPVSSPPFQRFQECCPHDLLWECVFGLQKLPVSGADGLVTMLLLCIASSYYHLPANWQVVFMAITTAGM